MPKPADRRRRQPYFDPTLRVGDAERNEVADALSQHYSAGRLDDTELKERLDRAMHAKTGADLSGLLTDLPSLDPSAPRPPVARRGRPRDVLWIALAAVFLLAAFGGGPFGHGPVWWPWWMALRIPWIVVGIAVLLLWRRARRRHWRAEMPS